MIPQSLRRAGLLPLLAGAAMLLPGCSGDDKLPPLVHGQKVRGKVTYQGRPVTYGVVLFYHHFHSLDAKTGMFIPSATGPINSDGTYEMTNVAAGDVFACVATHPECDIPMLTQPSMPGGQPGLLPNGLPGGPIEGGVPTLPGAPPGVAPIKPVVPQTEKMSAEERQTLKTIHAKYGIVGKSNLGFTIKEGEQTIDIPLK